MTTPLKKVADYRHVSPTVLCLFTANVRCLKLLLEIFPRSP
ncbi:hypothetical protein [Pseudomonas viridiflava]|nr:hypothetical protein [Pseudomonas viridiflava]